MKLRRKEKKFFSIVFLLFVALACILFGAPAKGILMSFTIITIIILTL